MHRIRFLAVLLLLLFLPACSVNEQTPTNQDVLIALNSTETYFLGLPVTTAETADVLTAGRQSSGTFPELRAYTADTPDTAHPVPLAAGDTAPTYYLPMNMQTDEWDDITLTAPGCTVFLVADDDIPDKSDALAGGHRFRLLICGEHYYQEAYLVCTGLPLLKIDLYNERRGTLTDSTNIERSPASTMQFSYYDPCDPTTGTVASDICAGTIRVRGGTSAKYDKHSFKLSLYDDFTLTDHHNLALCGLRRDEDWVLNAMYQEETKVRDMLAYDLWEDIGADHYGDGSHIGTRMRYVEVILGGKYWGLYGLCEPEDAKQFGLSQGKEGSVYKVSSWVVPTVNELRGAILHEQAQVAEVEVKYPEVTDASARDAWKPFLDYVEITYESSDFYFQKQIGNVMDEDNLADMWIFLNVIVGRDNRWKNLYLSYRADNGKLVMAPWDCDISFGLNWGESGDLHLYHEPYAFYEIQTMPIFDRYIELNVNDFRTTLANRWKELRETWLTTEEILTRAHIFRSLLEDSGALNRNRKKWPKSGDTTNLSYIEEFVNFRIPHLDAYIASLTEE